MEDSYDPVQCETSSNEFTRDSKTNDDRKTLNCIHARFNSYSLQKYKIYK